MNTFDPERYTITVKKEDTENGPMFVGRVLEFPDVSVYEDTRHEATDAVLAIIESLDTPQEQTNG